MLHCQTSKSKYSTIKATDIDQNTAQFRTFSKLYNLEKHNVGRFIFQKHKDEHLSQREKHFVLS